MQKLKEEHWDLTPLFSSLEVWKKFFESIKEEKKSPFWPSLKFRSTFKSAVELKVFLEKFFQIKRGLEKLQTYIQLKYDEDLSNDTLKANKERIEDLYSSFAVETSWIFPYLAGHISQLKNWLDLEELQPYRFYLQKII